jgi:hypothetical protein
MERLRSRMAEGGGGFGGGGGGGERRAAAAEGPRTQTLYVLESPPGGAKGEGGKGGVLRAKTVRLGVTDGVNTEVISGLEEGEVVVVGAITQSATTGSTTGSPMGSPFGGPTRMR